MLKVQKHCNNWDFRGFDVDIWQDICRTFVRTFGGTNGPIIRDKDKEIKIYNTSLGQRSRRGCPFFLANTDIANFSVDDLAAEQLLLI